MDRTFRTISMADRVIYPSQVEIVLMESRRRHKADINRLDALLEQRRAELKAEEAKEFPDMEYIARLRSIVGNLKNTLKSVQR